MKKFLSLVLALTMMMSLVTINAGAAEFTDDEDITYDEAVAVISEIGVVNGYEEGDFKTPERPDPSGRGQDHLQPDSWPHHRSRAARGHRSVQRCACQQ